MAWKAFLGCFSTLDKLQKKRWLFIGLVACFFSPGLLSAQTNREVYERDLIESAFDLLGLEPEKDPSGKIIEDILVSRHPIVEANDPWPDFVNLFHITTREHIVRQELLFTKGDRYQEDKVRESARNLRALPMIFSTVRIVTVKGTEPDRVRILVVTKDLWSIRINSQFKIVGTDFIYASFMPSEQNFLGYAQQLSLYTFIDRDKFSIGQVYRVPRLFGTRHTLTEHLVLNTNYHTQAQEGGFGYLGFGLPLYALDSLWAYSVFGSFNLGIQRFYEGGRLTQLAFFDGDQTWLLDKLWDYRYLSVGFNVTRSFGKTYKTNLTWGYTISSNTHELNESFPEVPGSIENRFRSLLPKDEKAGKVHFNLSFFEARYERFHNVQTFGITEDFRLGPSLGFNIAWANPAFGFAQQSVGLTGSLGYTLLLGKNILQLSGSLNARYQPDHGLEEALHTDWVNRSLEIKLENVSPMLFKFGRLFARIRYAYSQYNLSRAEYYLGGDNTLRGFISAFSSGPRLLNFNLEFRSVPWVIKTLHLGFVVFYDGGDAYGFTKDTDFEYHHSLGLGIRGLFPQFDRETMRLDMGIPLGKDFHSRVIDWVTISFYQAF